MSGGSNSATQDTLKLLQTASEMASSTSDPVTAMRGTLIAYYGRAREVGAPLEYLAVLQKGIEALNEGVSPQAVAAHVANTLQG